jgi:hypothetical protein
MAVPEINQLLNPSRFFFFHFHVLELTKLLVGNVDRIQFFAGMNINEWNKA